MDRSSSADDGGRRSSVVNSAVRFTFTVLLVGGAFSFFLPALESEVVVPLVSGSLDSKVGRENVHTPHDARGMMEYCRTA